MNAVLRPPLPASNLYFMSIMRIHQVKTGPFHEHSSQLHAIATGVPHWGKVNQGLLKMYDAEVLGKRVVVQHIPLGGLLEWDAPERDSRSRTAHGAVGDYRATTSSAPSALRTQLSGAAAPWATTATMPVIPSTANASTTPWAQTSTAVPWLPSTPTASGTSNISTRRPAGS